MYAYYMPRPKTGQKVRAVRFTDAEWAELQRGARAIGETRSEAVRAGSLSRVRQAIPDASDVTPGAWMVDGAGFSNQNWNPAQPDPVAGPIPDGWTVAKIATPATAVSPVARVVRPLDAAWEGVSPYPIVPGAPMPTGTPSIHVFACAYCPAKFATEFDAEAHIDNLHPEK